MTRIAVMGLQWGDEGKGRVIDWLSNEADMVVRCNGGANAGHTVPLRDGTQGRVHQLPSAAFVGRLTLVIGQGAVVDPSKLIAEINNVQSRGSYVQNRLFIHPSAHVICPWHLLEDAASEHSRGEAKIGTTKTGNGPAYADKSRRVGIQVSDFLSEMDHTDPEKLSWLKATQGLLRSAGLLDWIGEPCMRKDADVLYEIAHGFELDIDYGAYPFVTSSSCGIGAVYSGGGCDPRKIDHVVGVMKPYSTRIGAGPFPPAFTPEMQNWIRAEGGEYGTTTGRPRLIGMLDLDAVGHACWINGVDSIALTHFDIAKRLGMIPYIVHGEQHYCRCEDFISLIERSTHASVRLIADGKQRECMAEVNGGSDEIWGL